MTTALGNRMDREREQRASLAGQLEWRLQRRRDDSRAGEQAAFESALLNARQGAAQRSTGRQSNDDGTTASPWPPAELMQGISPVFSGAASPALLSVHRQEDAHSTSSTVDSVADNVPLQGANHAMPGLCAGHEAEQRQRGELPHESAVNLARLQGPAGDERAGNHWRFELAEQNLPVSALAVQRAPQGQLRVTLHATDHPPGISMQAPLLRLRHRLAEHGATLSAEEETSPLG